MRKANAVSAAVVLCMAAIVVSVLGCNDQTKSSPAQVESSANCAGPEARCGAHCVAGARGCELEPIAK